MILQVLLLIFFGLKVCIVMLFVRHVIESKTRIF
jgi:hypothetical protein